MVSEVAQGRSHEELPRVLTAANALAIVVGIIIGSGIFLVPREMMAAVGSSRMVYAVWITGGLLSLFGAMSYAEVAAMRPLYVVRDDVPADVLEKERRIVEQITRDEGKPEQAIPKIVEGRLNAFFKDVVLTEQPFVKEQKTAVKQVLAAGGVNVTGFARFQVGQA